MESRSLIQMDGNATNYYLLFSNSISSYKRFDK